MYELIHPKLFVIDLFFECNGCGVLTVALKRTRW